MTSSRTVLVTGCSSGIGKATALRLAQRRRDVTVFASARRRESLADLEACGCRTLALDVTDERSMKAAVDTIESEYGAVDVLVNNAGYAQSGAIEAVSLDRVRRQFETNVFGLVRLTQLVLPRMRARRRGRVINLSSVGGKLVFPGVGYYHATKYAVEAISDALRFEVRGFGIDIVVIEPGFIRSGFGDAAAAEMTPDGGEAYRTFHQAMRQASSELYERGLIARLSGTPEDVARTIERAVVATRPRTRYTVSPSATFLLAQRALLSDRLWDAVMRGRYPSPGTSTSSELAARHA